jgi:hypothetical protein
MSLPQMNSSEQLDQLSAMLADAIETGKPVPPEKVELIRTHALVNIAYHLSLISAQGFPQSIK